MLKVALSHDIDRIDKSYQRITHSIKSAIKFNFNSAAFHLLSKDTYWGFDEIIKIESEYNVRSTHFFLNESIKLNLLKLSTYKLALGRYSVYDKRIIDIISFLDKNGWEIGLHGSYSSYKTPSLLKTEKQVLEKIVGHEIVGIRQHYLNLNNITWEIQYNCGLKYDSSFGYNRDFGFKENKVAPWAPLKNDFIVFPQVIMDSPFINDSNRWEKLQIVLDDAEKNNGIVVINWHNNYFNEKEFPNFKSTYIRIIEECLKRRAVFKTLGQFYIDYCNENTY